MKKQIRPVIWVLLVAGTLAITAFTLVKNQEKAESKIYRRDPDTKILVTTAVINRQTSADRAVHRLFRAGARKTHRSRSLRKGRIRRRERWRRGPRRPGTGPGGQRSHQTPDRSRRSAIGRRAGRREPVIPCRTIRSRSGRKPRKSADTETRARSTDQNPARPARPHPSPRLSAGWSPGSFDLAACWLPARLWCN